MKRFQAMAQRITAFVLSAGMMASAAAPTVLAAQQVPSAPLGAENSVDELGNEDLSDETYHEPDDRGLAADAADHTWGEWYDGTYQEGEDGEIQNVKIRICSDCGVLQLEDGTVLTPSTDEKLEIVDPDEPEQLAPGVNLDGNYDDQIAPCDSVGIHDGAHQFDYTGATNVKVWYSRPTCTQTGSALVRCIKWWHVKFYIPFKGWQESSGQCDYSETHTINMAPHTWPSDGTVEQASPCVDGWKVWRCTVCNTELRRDKIGAKPHQYGDPITVKPTCEKGGRTYQKCSVCGDEHVIETTAPLGHSTDGVKWTKGDNSNVGWVVNQPYPCADGTKTRECDICHEKEILTVPATEEHQLTDWIVTVEPTCTTTGTRVKKCTVCGNVVKTETIGALGHDFQNYVDDNKPACCDQYETGTCTRCNAKNTRKTSGPIRAHKFTRYVLATFDGRLATRAYCDYEGCTAYDDKAISTKDYKENLCVLAATEASETIAKYADDVIKQAMRDAETAVKNASTREEAIASLDVIVASVRSQLLNKKIEGEVRADLDPEHKLPDLLHGAAIVKLPYSVTVTEDMVGSMLTDLQNGMNSVKEMLGSSFLSKDAIQTLIGKVADTVAKSDDINYSMRWIVYPEAYYQITAALNEGNGSYPGGDSDKAGEKATISNLILQLAGDLVQKDPNSETDAVQEFVSAIFDDLIDMLIEELKEDEEYSKYLNNALGDELLAELRPKLREELVNDTAFVDAVRGIVQIALSNAAAGVNKGWKEKAILAQLRSDLLKVQDPVEQEMIKLSGIIGDLVESSLAEKINKLLPFGDLTSWIGKKVGAFAKDKAVSEVVGETGRVRDTIELYIKYITCGEHHHVTEEIAATCTEPAYTIDSCDKCGWRFSKSKTGEPLGHVPVVDEAADPTETEEGLTEGSHCARCGAVLEAQEVIPALQPQMDAKLVCSAIPEETVTAMRYENRKKLDAAMDAALTKAGYTVADSQRFLAQVNSSIGILPSDRYPEEGFTGYVARPAQTAADKKYTWYAVQLLTVDAHGHNAGDVIITPVAQTDKGLQLTVYAQAVVALAWKEAK